MTKAQILAGLKAFLAQDTEAALYAMLLLYTKQTAAEQQRGDTTEDNGVGFSGRDGVILSSFCQQYQQRGRLSPKQWAVVLRAMPKYAGQLVRLAAEAKAAVVPNVENLYVSDHCDCVEGRLCACGAPATDAVEWERSSGGRYWESFCPAHAEAALAAHRARQATPEWQAREAIDRAEREAFLAECRAECGV